MYRNSVTRILVECWVFINLLLLPAAFAEPSADEPEILLVDNVYDSPGAFGKIIPLVKEPISSPPERAAPETSKKNYFLIPYVLLILSLVMTMHTGKLSRKAQITIFMLIGIVVVGSFAWLFSIAKSLNKTKLEAQVDSAVNELLQVTSVEEYITQCVQQVSKEGLRILGRQGGIFYPYQGAIIDYNESVSFTFFNETFNVSYLMLDMRHPGTGGFVQPIMALPYYPCPDVPRSPEQNPDNPCHYRYEKIQLGLMEPWWNWLPLLQYVYPLYRNETVLEYNIPAYAWPMETYDPPLTSVQRQLESYLSIRLQNCTDFNEFTEMLDYNITGEPPITTVIFGVDDVSFKIEYPVVVRVAGGEPVVRFLEFYATQPVRFKLMYETVAKLALLESRNDPYFNMSEWFENAVGGEGLLMETFVVEGPDGYSTSDVIVVQDRHPDHTLDGKFYSFIFAKKNRPPALDYSGQNLNSTGPLPTDSDHYYEFHVANGSSITIELFGVDPDDGDVPLLTYEIEGWKETWDDTFNESAFASENCTYFPERCTITNNSVQPGKWTASSLYQATKDGRRVLARYQTNESDLGYHLVTIKVDDGQYVDYQDIRILVVDVPTAVALGSNPYDDIPDNQASVEDPYFLDASATTSYFCEDIKYVWLDALETTRYGPGRLFNETTLNVVKLPYSMMTNTFDILNVTNATCPLYCPFNNATFSTHPVQLELVHSCGFNVENGQLPVEVYECLPHRSDAAPYPFHLLNYTNPFTGQNYTGLNSSTPEYFADHTCCDNSTTDYGHNLNDTNTCFNLYDYACRYESIEPDDMRAFVSEGDNLWPGTSPEPMQNPVPIDYQPGSFPPNSPNDVFIRNFTVQCSGERGNICNGDATDIWTLNKTCTQCQRCAPGNPNCANWGNSVICDMSLDCYDGSGNTQDGDTILSRIACNGIGNCTRFPTSPSMGVTNVNLAVDEFGIPRDPSGNTYFLSANCSYFDGYNRSTRTDASGITVPEDRDQPQCQGTCFSTGMNTCTTWDWSCGGSTCSHVTGRDLDDAKRFCDACSMQNVEWRNSGETVNHGGYNPPNPLQKACCGDDEDEHVTSCVIQDSGAVCGTSHTMCCSDPTDCTFDQRCYADNEINDTDDASDDLEVCDNGKWYDPDYSEDFCILNGGTWQDDEESDPNYSTDEASTVGLCCGDDPAPEGPLLHVCASSGGDTIHCIPGNEYHDSCCPSNDYCVAGGTCYEEGSTDPENDYAFVDSSDFYEYCDFGTWYDPDVDVNQYCDPDDILLGACCGDDEDEQIKLAYPGHTIEMCCAPWECAAINNSIQVCLPAGWNTVDGEIVYCSNGEINDSDANDLICSYEYSWEPEGEDTDFGEYGNDEDCEAGNGTGLNCNDNRPCNSSICWECCGDDPGETNLSRDCYTPGDCTSSTTDSACCNDPDDCVYDTVCQQSETANNFTADGPLSCFESEWYDPDANPRACAIFDEGNGGDWIPGCDSTYPITQCYVSAALNPYSWPSEYSNLVDEECCGDETDEHYISWVGTRKCCAEDFDCLWQSTSGLWYCSNSSESEWQPGGSCGDLVDNDCDNLIDCQDIIDCAGKTSASGVDCCDDDTDCWIGPNNYSLSCDVPSFQCGCEFEDPFSSPIGHVWSNYMSFGSTRYLCSYPSGLYDRFISIPISPSRYYTVIATIQNYGNSGTCSAEGHYRVWDGGGNLIRQVFPSKSPPDPNFVYHSTSTGEFYVGFRSGGSIDCKISFRVNRQISAPT